MTRATTAYVSPAQRDRIHQSRFRRQEKRTITADFTAMLEPGETITEVTWRTDNPWVLRMGAPAIDAGKVTVVADLQYAGCTSLKATVTTSTGQILNQTFRFEVADSPYFQELGPMTSGPYQITTNA